jgi:hypothetical protein
MGLRCGRGYGMRVRRGYIRGIRVAVSMEVVMSMSGVMMMAVATV